MKSLVYRAGQKVAVGIALSMLLLSPFTALPVQAQVGAETSATQVAANTSNNTQNPDIFANCSFSSASGIGVCISSVVYFFTIGLGSVFAYFAANLFDTAVQLSLNSSAYGLDFVSVGWTTARDLANMGFLFILIYIAFTIIFRADTSSTMSTLALVIVVALLVNFSFFFSRLAIDAGNILAIQFYNSIPAPPVSASPIQNIPLASTAIQYLGPGAYQKDLSASIMNMLQIQNLLNVQSFQNASVTGSTFTAIFIYIAAAVILWILTVTFATNAAKFLFRIVALWLLIIASPLAFIAAAVQGFGGGYFKQWRDMLFANAVYPVAFLFVFLLLTNFANEVAQNGSLFGNVFTQLQGTSGQNWGSIIGAVSSIVIRLVLVVGVMYIGMRLADRVGVAGAKYADKFGGWAGDRFKNAYSWAGGTAYRNTVPRAASAIDDRVKNSRWANTPGTLGGVLGYRLRKNVLAPAKSSSIGTVASSFEQRQKYLKTRKDEMETNIRDSEKKADEKLTNIKNREDTRKLGDLNKQWSDYSAKEKQASKELEEMEKLHAALTANRAPIPQTDLDALEDKKRTKAYWKERQDAIRPEREQLIANAAKMDGPQVVALNGKDISGIIEQLNEKQIKAVKENLKFTKEERDNLEKQWQQKSSHAPLAESKDQLKKLNTAVESLNKVGIDMSKLPKLYELIKPAAGAIVVNLASTQTVKKELVSQKEEQENIRDDQTKRDTREGKIEITKAGRAVKELDKAIKQIEKLEERVKDIPVGIGHEGKEGQFKHEV